MFPEIDPFDAVDHREIGAWAFVVFVAAIPSLFGTAVWIIYMLFIE